MSREQTQHGFYEGGTVGDIVLYPLARAKHRLLGRAIEGKEDEDVIDIAFFCYAHSLEELRACDDIPAAAEAWVENILVEHVTQFAVIFMRDSAAIEASLFSAMDSGKPQGEPSPTQRQSSTGRQEKRDLATANNKK